ncbi:MAG: hypothetical protein RSD22_06035 [Romboutsia sp.]
MKNITIEQAIYIQKDLISLGLGVAEGSLNKDDIKGFLLKKRQ